MNNGFSVEFFGFFVAALGFAFCIMSMWVMYDLDKDDKKPHKKPKTKKA